MATHDPKVVASRPPEAAGGPRSLAAILATGFAMGCADVVPGFSGGTVALVAGIYERLIANVRQGARTLSLLLRGRLRDAWAALLAVEWLFLTTLLAGIVTAIVALASLLHRLLEEHPVLMSAVFFGLILGATVVAARELRRPAPHHAVLVAGAAAVTFVALGVRSGTVDDPSLLVVFAAGAVAICAMILPGVSGAFLLLLLGLYTHVIGAVHGRDLAFLAVLALGCLVGLASFSTLLNWLLRRYHDLVLAVLLGLMLGSVRVLWPWPSDLGIGNAQLGAPVAAEVPGALAGAVSAAAVVVGLGVLATRRSRPPS